MINRISIFIPAFLILSSFIYAQIKIGGSVESGYYRAEGTQSVEQNDLFTGLDGQLGYNYKNDRRRASIKLRIRPEFYGLNNQLNTLKIRGDVSYFQNENPFTWGVSLSDQKYNIKSSTFNLTYNTFILSGNVESYLNENLPISFTLGYGYQDIGYSGQQNLDLFFGDIRLFQMLSENLKFGYGMYLEKFSITGRSFNFTVVPGEENSGWRFGPEISLNYLGDEVINLEYRFLFHNSKYTDSPSIEHWIRLVAGKLITSHFSTFILIDYYIRNFKYVPDADKYSYLLYTTMNFDNRIFLKLSYEINNNVELYFRSGYFKENLYSNKYNFDGWNALFGIDLSN